MLTFPNLPGVDVNIFLLAFLGFAVGLVGGFIGVGGGFMITPALIVLGLPGNLAVGSGITSVVGTTSMAALRHRSLGNVDAKLGLLLIVGTIPGMELGVRLLNWSTDHGLSSESVLAASTVILVAMGSYVTVEALSAKRKLDKLVSRTGSAPRDVMGAGAPVWMQRVRIPPVVEFPLCRVKLCVWLVVLLGFVIGVLSGFMGIGGAFMLTPLLMYLFGVPSLIAVGTSVFQVAFGAAYSCIRHGMSGNVLLLPAVVIVLGAAIGTEIGSLGTRYVRGPSIRGVLGCSVIIGAAGALFKLSYALTGDTLSWLQRAAEACTFGGLALLMVLIAALLTMALLYRRGMHVPKQLESLLIRDD